MTEFHMISVCYILSMGICGIVLVCVCSTLGQISVKVGLNGSTELGTIFIARGIGSIGGAAISSVLFNRFDGNDVLTIALALILTLLLIIPLNTSLSLLYIMFFFIGLGTSITDTGCQIMTRKLHGHAAGPWLSANTVAFGASAIFVPAIEIFSKNVIHQYQLMAGFVGVVLLLLTIESYRSKANRNNYNRYYHHIHHHHNHNHHYHNHHNHNHHYHHYHHQNSIDGLFIDSFDDIEKQYRITHITAPDAHFDHLNKYHKILEEKRTEKQQQVLNNTNNNNDNNNNNNDNNNNSNSITRNDNSKVNDSYDDIPNEILNSVKRSSSASSLHSKLIGHKVEDLIPHYRCEICASIMAFCLVGGNVALTAYLDSYLAETGVVEVTSIPKLLLVLWIAITVGRLLGVKDQMQLSEYNLILHFAIVCVSSCLAIFLIFIFPKCGSLLWIAIAVFGVSNGPTVGYCYDLVNRLTYPTEKSMSIVMFGLNAGASIVPFITTWLWHRNGPAALMQIEFLTNFIPIPLIFITSALRYEQKKEDTHKITKYKIIEYKSLEMIELRSHTIDDIPLD